ncbi:hypothetical protein FKW77_001966 [Venturia effusa]|uniref:ubiquitinyl hydrolase 1 n=1 Tax=Venturia effusa TaxID=50376 RepID=A0A517LNG2_9PEZI|nr:hypothetical protein FKW77_001966 [Venturia effusa]
MAPPSDGCQPAMSTACLRYMIDHVFMPPKLPQKDDSAPEHDQALMEQVYQALKKFEDEGSHFQASLIPIIAMLENMIASRGPDGVLIQGTVVDQMGAIENNDVLAFHIKPQNSALFIRRADDLYVFETFEVSCPNAAIMGTLGRLQRTLPSEAVAISSTDMLDSSFRIPFTEMLIKLDSFTPENAYRSSSKAGSKMGEIRNAVDPRYFTELVFGILRGIGKPKDILRVDKNVRDDVNWSDVLHPWRRSPLWTVLRVALQSSFEHQNYSTRGNGRGAYKAFMAFFMSLLLDLATVSDLPNDLLYCMQIKIVRRLQKVLSADGQPSMADSAPWLKSIDLVVRKTAKVVQNKWKAIQDDPDPFETQVAWEPSTLSFKIDTNLRVSGLRKYCHEIELRENSETTHGITTVKTRARLPIRPQNIPDAKLLTGKVDDAHRLLLADVELWVEQCLDSWRALYCSRSSSCSAIASLMAGYHAQALNTYKGDPESLSIMFLTIFELWVCLDTIATRHEPMLLDYDPGLDTALFEPLLLPRKRQLERLAAVEQHIEKRQQRKKFNSIFTSFAARESIAVRYFDRSLKHQDLLASIEQGARAARNQKKTELVRKKQEQSRLEAEAARMDHEKKTYFVFNKHTRKSEERTKHDNRCQKCISTRRAKDMEIDIHEWPLPAETLQAKAVVFELQCPETISLWRDSTYFMLLDVLTAPSAKERAGAGASRGSYTLQEYGGLNAHYTSRAKRLVVASTVKQFELSHYKSKAVSFATETSICVRHACQFNIFDSASKLRADLFVGCCGIRTLCTQQLPQGPYRRLQSSVGGAEHVPNRVIARQSDCPAEISLPEYLAFGHLRDDHCLQWQSIGLALRDGSLNFNQEATRILLTQAAWEAGPKCPRDDNILRETHVMLDDSSFCMDILQSLDAAIEATEQNWQGTTSIQVFVALVLRMLTISPDLQVREACMRVLETARHATLSWLRRLRDKLRTCDDDQERQSWTLSALEIALSCFSTFGVESDDIELVLDCANSISIFVECAVTIHDLCPASNSGLPHHIRQLLLRASRMTHSMEAILYKILMQNPTALDLSFGRLWTSFRPGSPWRAVEEGKTEWIQMETSGDDDNITSVIVQFNLLSGSLLVNGSPLSRLPPAYEAHDLYLRLFGKKALSVVPSTMVGMVYGSRDDVCGHKMDFALYEGNLVIRATKNGRVYEILPPHCLKGDFPPAFAKHYSHWLDIASNAVEFRSLTAPWQVSNETWILNDWKSSHCWLRKGATCHVDTHSKTTRAIVQVLSAIETVNHIHISFTDKSGMLEIFLPRLKLNFFVNQQQDLECKQRRGMIIDRRQSCGTFTGLKNMLVLCSIKDNSRSIIIPHGLIESRFEGDHVEAIIDSGKGADVPYYYYEVDELLHRLTDDGRLGSILFRTLLHAVTSHCLADKFTGRTGTEQALHCLQEASTHSFRALGDEEIALLKMIGTLTPCRKFYPEHLQEMQKTRWHEGLPALSQHELFHDLVNKIFQRARQHEVFHSPGKTPNESIFGNELLLKRAAIRMAVFRGPDSGAGSYAAQVDTTYNSTSKRREREICELSRLVNNWSTDLTVSKSLLSDVEAWGESINGCDPYDFDSLGFDKSWLGASKCMSEHWCSLIFLLSRTDKSQHKYRLMIFLSTLLYSSEKSGRLVQTLLSFATVPELRLNSVPNYPEFDLSNGYKPKKVELVSSIQACANDFDSCPESNLPQLDDEHEFAQADARRRGLHEEACLQIATKLAVEFIAQWPIDKIVSFTTPDSGTYFNMGLVLSTVSSLFAGWYENKAFQDFTKSIEGVLSGLKPSTFVVETYTVPLVNRVPRTVSSPCVSWEKYFENEAPSLKALETLELGHVLHKVSTAEDCHQTRAFLDHLAVLASDQYEKAYCRDMVSSLESLEVFGQESLSFVGDDNNSAEMTHFRSRLQDEYYNCKTYVEALYNQLCTSGLESATLADKLAHEIGVWPRLTPTTLLKHLSDTTSLTSSWKDALLQYGLAVTQLQYYQRVVNIPGNGSELMRELLNTGHIGWDPKEYPEWLLFEVENSLLIRPEQAQIAMEMLSPSSGGNSVYQLNMGEGKSSVIVPIVAATLAKGQQLPRVIVLPALATQMFHILRQKLGGMLNCKVVSMPFSRAVKLSTAQADMIQSIYEDCFKDKCVILSQPEYILSFDLLGIEKSLSDSKDPLGSKLVATQQWIDRNTRDILDESDEILNVKFELIYTIGMQNSVDFSPHRWIVTMGVLDVLQKCLDENMGDLKQKSPDGLRVQSASIGAFPRLQILQSQAGDMLLKLVLDALLEGFSGIRAHLNTEEKTALFEYISKADQPPPLQNPILASLFETEYSRMVLLLLKGIFGHGVLQYVFQHKRWRVTYGHDFSRSGQAVPYRAKDLPALRATFSHPDVTILLTCLSYYYQGLSDEQLMLCFGELLASDDPAGEYDSWVKSNDMIPNAFKHLSGINLRDQPQCTDVLFPIIRWSKPVLDFYMSRLVFPKEMKEFPQKLSSSGWDIARKKSHPITGFSGTNDSRYLLPLSITQADLPQMIHTNATVLDCLLQTRNSYSVIPSPGDTNAILDLVVTSTPEIRMIIDVGALVLDWRNAEMAQRWLERVQSSTVEAVVYFDNQDELVVLTRDGRVQALQESHLLKQLDKCLVYLDQAHSRGVDLKLPSSYRAAATLGLDLKKDELVQACMRLRKLAHGQSVMLCAPHEIHNKIVECSGRSNLTTVGVEDVLIWSMSNTHEFTRKCVPLWSIQGLRHLKRDIFWHSDAANPKAILEPEAKSLATWYQARESEESAQWLRSFGDDIIEGRPTEVEAIRQKMEDFGTVSINSAALQEEQERELSPESEQERQQEPTPKMAPAKSIVGEDLARMVKQGWLNPKSETFVPAFQSLTSTRASDSFNLRTWPSGLFVTKDFSLTVQAAKWQKQDQFIRSVQWILSCPKSNTLAIISPAEANKLHPLIRVQDKITLHVYSPRIKDSMSPLDDLSYCAVPSRSASDPSPELYLRIQLNLFAGQLYFKDRREYESACRFLGLAFRAPEPGVSVTADGFVAKKDREKYDPEMARICTIKKSPVTMLRRLMECRRKGQPYAKTHMGALLDGKLLKDNAFSTLGGVPLN